MSDAHHAAVDRLTKRFSKLIVDADPEIAGAALGEATAAWIVAHLPDELHELSEVKLYHKRLLDRQIDYIKAMIELFDHHLETFLNKRHH